MRYTDVEPLGAPTRRCKGCNVFRSDIDASGLCAACREALSELYEAVEAAELDSNESERFWERERIARE